MSMTTDAIGPATAHAQTLSPRSEPVAESHIDKFFSDAIAQMKQRETKMRESFSAASDPDSAIMRMPDHVVQEFKRLDNAAKTPEDRALVERFRRGVTETFEANRDFYRNKMESKLDTLQTKLGSQFVSNTVKGVQQLLSSQ
ncbi:MAG: hypothetical protein AAFR79_07160 [Pseudomonadota bacterium]